MSYNAFIETGIDGKKYKVLDGTWYHVDTDDKVITQLEYARFADKRLIVEYGDGETGKSWGDKVTGYMGRSTGTIKIPLAIYNKRSHGGPELLENCIVLIRASKGKKILYKHRFYNEGNKS